MNNPPAKLPRNSDSLPESVLPKQKKPLYYRDSEIFDAVENAADMIMTVDKSWTPLDEGYAKIRFAIGEILRVAPETRGPL